MARLREGLAAAGVRLTDGLAAEERLRELRRMYEPYVNALAEYLLMALPSWLPVGEGFDSWQTSAWERVSARKISDATVAPHPEEHF